MFLPTEEVHPKDRDGGPAGDVSSTRNFTIACFTCRHSVCRHAVGDASGARLKYVPRPCLVSRAGSTAQISFLTCIYPRALDSRTVFSSGHVSNVKRFKFTHRSSIEAVGRHWWN
jgi:hypothetical protein